MKRGLISWDRAELPAVAFDARLGALYKLCADFDVPALVAYSDVCRSNDVRYISNYMPYWNRAPHGRSPWREARFCCARSSPRVYPWIKSVTVHETILPSPNLPAQLLKVCTEKGWSKVGMLDHAGLPNDLYTQFAAEKLEFIDIPHEAFRPVATEFELGDASTWGRCWLARFWKRKSRAPPSDSPITSSRVDSSGVSGALAPRISWC